MKWEKLLQIDDEWLTKFLVNQGINEEAKIKVRGYSIKFSGNLYSFTGLAEYLSQKIPEFVYGPEGIKQLGERKAAFSAIKYFGEKFPATDGKYGELFLFMLVESVLKCPMIAYKIQSLSNFKDQVKGGDGIFLGDYKFNEKSTIKACLIGESKIMKAYSGCVDDALDSLDRFYNKVTSGQFITTEYMVAKKNIVDTLECDIDYLYDCLTPGTEEFHQNTLVHPVFLMYDTKQVDDIEKNAVTHLDAEELMREYFFKRGKQHMELIKKKLIELPHLQKVILDFFIIPCNDISKFRNELYYQIHGVPFRREEI